MVAINLTIGDNGIITRAYEAKYLTELSTCIEELQVFKYSKKLENNELYNKDKTELITVLYEITGKYTVKENVTRIGYHAFYYQDLMTGIELPEGILAISDDAFIGCSGITEIYIPESIKAISTRAFAGTNNLNKIQINKEPGSITGSPWGAIKGDRIVEWLK